jgi:hypothetical protein
MAGEIEELVDYLYRLSNREEVPMEFHRAFIRFSAIRVAKTWKINRTIAPYIKAMQVGLGKDVFSIYVLIFDKGWLGAVNPAALEQFEKQIRRLEAEIETGTEAVRDFDVEYTAIDERGKPRRCRCIRYLAPSQQKERTVPAA